MHPLPITQDELIESVRVSLQHQPNSPWHLRLAVDVCTFLEWHLPEKAGCHIALTGGTLYKPGHRKDLDLLIYRIRQNPLDKDRVLGLLSTLGFCDFEDYGFVVKCTFAGAAVDILFPDNNDNSDYRP